MKIKMTGWRTLPKKEAKLDTQTADWAAKHADFADKKCCPKSSKIPKSLQSQAVPSCFGFNSTVNSEQSAFTPCQVQKPPKSNSYNSEGQRPRESWWRAASLDDLRREQGVRPSTSLCSKQAGTTGNSTGPEEAKAKALAEAV
ncbi:unnamed protein product [Durusdinium trenchii]|uniref:Uncharacterized protein n=1 Tax=Durusdinium trenchii TaxID=1381693 RepID=A0ABP0JKL4_9DINO